MSTPLALARELTIYTAAEARQQWLAWIAPADLAADAGDRLHLDAAAVDEVDAAGVQLLLSLSQALSRQHRTLCLDRPSGALVRACEALGVAALLVPPKEQA